MNLTKLRQFITSDENVQELVHKILSVFKIKSSAAQKCARIVTQNFNRYLTELEQFPESYMSLSDMIVKLNNRCFDDFNHYFRAKYPHVSVQPLHCINWKTEQYPATHLQASFLQYLKNPRFLQTVYEAKVKDQPHIIFDQILSKEEAVALMNETKDTPHGSSSLLLPTCREETPIAYHPTTLTHATTNRPLLHNSIAPLFVKDAIAPHLETLDKKLEKNALPELPDDVLSFEIDPSTNYLDLQNITIKINGEDKIEQILLLSYYVLYNENNIHRLNNTLTTCYNGEVIKTVIDVGVYTIERLLDKINQILPFVQASLDGATKRVTLKNIQNNTFDLLCDKNSFLHLLGFTENDTLQNKSSYTSSKACNVEANKEVFIRLAGSTKEPIPLRLNEAVTLTPPGILKRVTRGVTMKELVIKLLDGNDQYYDFKENVKLCLKIIYLP